MRNYFRGSYKNKRVWIHTLGHMKLSKFWARVVWVMSWSCDCEPVSIIFYKFVFIVQIEEQSAVWGDDRYLVCLHIRWDFAHLVVDEGNHRLSNICASIAITVEPYKFCFTCFNSIWTFFFPITSSKHSPILGLDVTASLNSWVFPEIAGWCTIFVRMDSLFPNPFFWARRYCDL